jgi:Ni/Co efflux regulator RcnB
LLIFAGMANAQQWPSTHQTSNHPRGGKMKKAIATLVLACFSVLGLALPQTQSTTTTTTTQESGVKQDAKDAGHATKRATKKTVRKTKKKTKKVAHKSAKKTREGAEKVEDKTTR